MDATIDEKEIKKMFAKQKRKVSEIAGEIHDIVEDTIWVDYVKLPALSEQIQDVMSEVVKMREQYEFLQ
jgi:enamine deaminase RidA (YjgF/YER057c/UK114 family)